MACGEQFREWRTVMMATLMWLVVAVGSLEEQGSVARDFDVKRRAVKSNRSPLAGSPRKACGAAAPDR